MGQWDTYLIIIFALGGLFFASAICALYWSVKQGQLADFEEGAKSIFTEEEPLGEHTDSFPGATPKS